MSTPRTNTSAKPKRTLRGQKLTAQREAELRAAIAEVDRCAFLLWSRTIGGGGAVGAAGSLVCLAHGALSDGDAEMLEAYRVACNDVRARIRRERAERVEAKPRGKGSNVIDMREWLKADAAAREGRVKS